MLNATYNFREGLVRHRTELRAFAQRLAGNPAQADDLVQETLVKALANESKFTLGTNLRAWLFRILKNTFLSEIRREKLAASHADDAAPNVATPPNQVSALTLKEVKALIDVLPDSQRRVIELVGIVGWSYHDAARFCGCEIGTIKSRLSRARASLMNDACLSGEI